MELQQQLPLPDPLNSTLISYRNGYYQGTQKSNLRHGPGILITDTNTVIIGTWKNNQLSGPALIFLPSRQFGIVEFNRGQLDGLCYFKKNPEMLVGELENNRPVEKLLHANYDTGRVRIVGLRNGGYETLEVYDIQQSLSEQQLILKYLKQRQKLPPSLTSFITQTFLLKYPSNFSLTTLPTDFLLLTYNDSSNIYSLGIVLDTSQKLSSFGIFSNNKLNGIGCKFQGEIKYEGIFQNGFMNGVGLKETVNKVVFGKFQEGNLVDVLESQERNGFGEFRCVKNLELLKKQQHISSLFFENTYLKIPILKHRGLSEIIHNETKPTKQYLYPQSRTQKQDNKPKSINQSIIQAISKQSNSGNKSNTSNSWLVNLEGKKYKRFDDFHDIDEVRSEVSSQSALGKLKKFNL